MEKITINGTDVFLAPIPEGPESRRVREKAVIAKLLDSALPGFQLMHLPSGAPYVNSSDVRISISHSQHFAALAICYDNRPVGIDIEEQRTEQLQRVVTRFMSDNDLLLCPDLLMAWTAKEAVFKAADVSNAVLADINLLPTPDGVSFSAELSGFGFSVTHHRLPSLILAIARPQ